MKWLTYFWGILMSKPFTCANLDNLKDLIQQSLSPDLLLPIFRQTWSESNPTAGFCSVASEAAWFVLGGSPNGWGAYTARDNNNVVHWWLQHTSGLVFDPTSEQYTSQNIPLPYHTSTIKACGFMGVRKDPDNEWGFQRKPSHRAQKLLNIMKHNTLTHGEKNVFKRPL